MEARCVLAAWYVPGAAVLRPLLGGRPLFPTITARIEPTSARESNVPARRPVRVAITTRTMVVAALVVGAAYVAVRLAPVLLVVIVALSIVGTLDPAIEWLQKKGIKRGFGIALVFSALFAVVVATVALTVPVLIEQVMALVREEPALRGRLVEQLARSRATVPLADMLRKLDYTALLKDVGATALEYSKLSLEIVAYGASAIFLALYIIIDREKLRTALYSVVPRTHHVRLSRVMINLELIVGGYIRGQLLTSALMTAFTFALLMLCGVSSALAIGVVAGIADVLPYIGVFLSVGPAVAAASSQGFVVVLIVLGAMLAYEELESRVLVPRIYGSVLKLPSSVVLFALLTGGALMGIAGALLALPVAAALRMLVEELRVALPGETADPVVQATDARGEQEYERRTEGLPVEKAAAIAMEISLERTEVQRIEEARSDEISAAKAKAPTRA